MKKPDGRAPSRRVATSAERRVVRVLTEGTVTEQQYLTTIRRAYRHVTISIDRESAGAVPGTLVREAKQQLAAARRSRGGERKFDEIWCVFDTDEHPGLPAALAEARAAGVGVAMSNPCFELWLILHAEDQAAWIHRDDAQRRSADLGLTTGKSICSPTTLVGSVTEAIRRARLLDERHEGNGSPAGDNPSSGMWRLLESIRPQQGTT